MAVLNANFKKLQDNYLFSTVSLKVKKYKEKNPSKEIISLGIGDVSLPLPKVSIDAMHFAVSQMSCSNTFKGYGPEQGYLFLRNKIAEFDYANLGISSDEIFISDGSKCDVGRIIELFDINNIVAIPDPVYPVYVDTNVIAGRSGVYNKESKQFENIVYLPMNSNNDFIPQIPSQKVDLIYLCSPNNPTGSVLSKRDLSSWVEYAIHNNAVILYDSAYEAFITDAALPHSIYEIKNAKKVAIELRSFSKTAGFTGIRCGYTVIPNELEIDGIKLINLYKRLISTKFNGTSYISQKAAEALYSPDGINEIKQNIDYYLNNAKIIKDKLIKLKINCWGGKNSPYIWFKIPYKLNSWEFFDLLLQKSQVVGTPGAGFGPNGEGYFRFTAFNSLENTTKAMDRFEQIFE